MTCCDAIPASTYVTGFGQGSASISASIAAALGGKGGVGGVSSVDSICVVSCSFWVVDGSRGGGGEAVFSGG